MILKSFQPWDNALIFPLFQGITISLIDRSKKELKFKNGLAGTNIEEFCALKPKLYSIVAGE